MEENKTIPGQRQSQGMSRLVGTIRGALVLG